MRLSAPRTPEEQLKQKETRISKLQQQLYWAQLKIQKLEEILRQERIARFGVRSEKLSDLQLALLDEEPSVTADEVAAEAERPSLPEGVTPLATDTPKRERKKHPGRQTLPAHLPRKEETLACSEEACTCKHCGERTAVIGCDESEQLDVEPAQYFVRVTNREKRACRHCEKRTVVVASLPDRIVEKGLASDRVVVDTLIKKYCDHLPLYRQEVILRRETGLEISRTTLDGWVMHVGELLIPVREAMRKDLLAGGYIQADETTVLVQAGEKRGSHHEGYLWQFGRPGGEVVFEFALGRGRDVAARFLWQWEGKLQADAYVGYERVGGSKLIHYGCFAHARRYFVDAVKVNKDNGEAAKMVIRMDALFTVERGAAELGLTGAEKLEFRRKHGQSWLDEMDEVARWLVTRTLPRSKMARVCTIC